MYDTTTCSSSTARCSPEPGAHPRQRRSGNRSFTFSLFNDKDRLAAIFVQQPPYAGLFYRGARI